MMFIQTWNKYLPIIKILIKRTAQSDQILELNRIDFEKAGISKKMRYKFDIEMENGRVSNIISSSALAKDLAAVLLEDETMRERFSQNNYHFSMSPKFQLSIKLTSSNTVELVDTVTDAVTAD